MADPGGGAPRAGCGQRQSTVKMKLATLFHDPAFVAFLRNAALGLSQARLEASHLLCWHVLRLVEAHREQGGSGSDPLGALALLDDASAKLVRQALWLVMEGRDTRRELDAALVATWEEYRAARVAGGVSPPAPPSRVGLARPLAYAAQQLQRNIKLHVVGNFESRLFKWCALQAWRAAQGRLAGQALGRVARSLQHALQQGDPAEASLPPHVAVDTSSAAAQQLQAWVTATLVKYGSGSGSSQAFPSKDVAWWRLFDVLCAMCADAVELAASASAPGAVGSRAPPKAVLRAFSVMPLCGFRTGHVLLLDTAGLQAHTAHAGGRSARVTLMPCGARGMRYGVCSTLQERSGVCGPDRRR